MKLESGGYSSLQCVYVRTVTAVLIVGGWFFTSCFPPVCVCVQHEKYTSQLQLSIKALEAKAKEKLHFQHSEKSKDSLSNAKLQDKAERKAHSLTGK